MLKVIISQLQEYIGKNVLESDKKEENPYVPFIVPLGFAFSLEEIVGKDDSYKDQKDY